jgi:hypothetical protein
MLLAPVSQPAGELPPGMIVATFGAAAQLINFVVLGQAIRLPPLRRVVWICSWRIGQCLTSVARSCRHQKRTARLRSSVKAGEPLGYVASGEADVSHMALFALPLP